MHHPATPIPLDLRAPLLLACLSATHRSRVLAREQGDLALASLACLPDTPARRSLEQMVDLVLDRIY